MKDPKIIIKDFFKIEMQALLVQTDKRLTAKLKQNARILELELKHDMRKIKYKILKNKQPNSLAFAFKSLERVGLSAAKAGKALAKVMCSLKLNKEDYA